MTYSKTYRVVVPIEHGADVETARWLARESFDKKAVADALELKSYDERVVDPSEIDPRTIELLGRPATDFQWFEFSGVAELNQVLFDWCAAECLFNFEDWLAKEREWKASQLADVVEVQGEGG